MAPKLIIAAALAAVACGQATITSCGGSLTWLNITLTPANPQAGDTAVVNATGVNRQLVVAAGTGDVSAYLYGTDMFDAPINTCGLGQQINILDQTTAIFDGLTCPSNKGATVKIGVVVPIPSDASGLGALVIDLSANNNDTKTTLAYCFNLTLTL